MSNPTDPEDPRCAACGSTEAESGGPLYRHHRHNGHLVLLCFNCGVIPRGRFAEPCLDEDELRELDEFWDRRAEEVQTEKRRQQGGNTGTMKHEEEV